MKAQPSGLREFLRFVGDFKQMSSVTLKGILVAPAVSAVAKLAPPPEVSTTIATLLFQFSTLLWIFQFWSKLDRNKLEMRMRMAAVTFVICAMASFVLIERFSVPIGHSRDRVVIGYHIRPELNSILNPTFTSYDALAGSEYDPNRVWTTDSVLVMQATLIGMWICTFVALTMFIATFLLLQRTRLPSAKN